jgi:hypothetical protein
VGETADPVSSPAPTLSPSAIAKPKVDIELPMKAAKSLEGIISYLTKKHGGNVHEKGIVTITSKPGRGPTSAAPANVADLTSDSVFCSEGEEPCQWVSWDFREMRIFPTHYTIQASELMCWVVEVSLDGEWWKEIDRQTYIRGFSSEENEPNVWNILSFAVSKPVQCRFIRLTQTCLNNERVDYLALRAVEFFGMLSE